MSEHPERLYVCLLLIHRLHDQANIEQTSNVFIMHEHDVRSNCLMFAWCLLHRLNGVLLQNCSWSGDDNSTEWCRAVYNSLSQRQTLCWSVVYTIQQTSSKRPALARVFWIHLLEVCWTFAGSCKYPIRGQHFQAQGNGP